MQAYATHVVSNQAPPFVDVNLFECDVALREALVREGAEQASTALRALGARLGCAEVQQLARLANCHGPQLAAFDAQGRRIDRIECHPAWHSLLAMLIEAGAHSAPWEAPGRGAQVARAAAYLLFGQAENGVQCPVTMTFAAVPVLARQPRLGARWLASILSRQYDPRPLPMRLKRGVLIGMGMTEKQGGSDVRANTTWAEPATPAQSQCLADSGEPVFRLVGHKWFFSVPQADAHLVLARDGQQGQSLSCFLVPAYLDDGQRNAVRLQRLKDKLGNRSNASAEVEFCQALGVMVGEPGRGISTILEMGAHTRLDCVLGSAGIMRAALCHALHHARGRQAFGKALAAQPLMANVLVDLALESEAATCFALRLARCFDEQFDPAQALLARVLTAAGKYWICKRGPGFGAEAMEVMGGNGYVEEAPLARLYREFPVNSIWEGSGNVMCLDLLRVLGKSGPAVSAALQAELQAAAGQDPRLARYVEQLLAALGSAALDEYGARRLAERIVLAVQAALLVQHAPGFVADAFVQSRIASDVGGAYGRLPAGVDCAAILARSL